MPSVINQHHAQLYCPSSTQHAAALSCIHARHLRLHTHPLASTCLDLPTNTCTNIHTGLGLALEAAKTLQPGETLLVSQPLAAVPRSPEAAAALAADAEASASSSGSWVVPLDEEIEAVADQLAAGAQKQQQQQRQQVRRALGVCVNECAR